MITKIRNTIVGIAIFVVVALALTSTSGFSLFPEDEHYLVLHANWNQNADISGIYITYQIGTLQPKPFVPQVRPWILNIPYHGQRPISVTVRSRQLVEVSCTILIDNDPKAGKTEVQDVTCVH